jgi:membrane fusion protein (multidrug efflux system)
MKPHPNYKIIEMKSKFFGIIVLAFLMASCGSGKKDKNAALNDKKAELVKLKEQQKDLNAKVSKLETEIAKLDTTAANANAKLIAVTAVGTSAFTHYIEIQGKVDAQNISYVAPPNGQGGVVTALYITQGQSVSRGQVIAKLDDQLIRQNIEPLRVQLSAAEDTYRRTKNLFDQGIGAYQTVLNAKTQVESLQKQIDVLQRQVSLMTVKAPVSGVVDQLNIRVGEMLSAAANAQNPQIRIVNTNDLKVTAQVPENFIGRVGVGSVLEVIVPEENNRIISTTVNVAAKLIDPNTRTFLIEAKIPSSANLKPNQLVKVHIKDYGNPNAITIPVNTLQNDESGKFVMLATTEKGKLVARKRTVTIGELYNDQLEVKSGLQAGDTLITEGFQGLYDGQVVTTSAK